MTRGLRLSGLASFVQVIDDTLTDGFGVAFGSGGGGKEFGVFRVGKVGRFRDDGRNAGFLTGVEPVTAAASSVVAEDGGAGDAVIRHALLKDGFVDDIRHFPGKSAAAGVAVHGSLVVNHPVVGVAVVVQEYHAGGFLVKRVVHAEHAHRHAARLVAGAVNAGHHRGVDLVNTGFLSCLCQLFVGRRRPSVADAAGVARLFNDTLGVDDVAVPELTFLYAAVAGIRGARPLTAAFRVVVVTDVQYHRAGFPCLRAEPLLGAGAEEQGNGDAEQKKKVFHNGNCV